MDVFQTKDLLAAGLDQNYRTKQGKASKLEFFRVHESLGWINDRGWEPLFAPTNPITISNYTDTFSPTRFLNIWSRHQGAEQYYLYERNGKLRYDFMNIGNASTTEVILDSDRNEPKPDDPGTQLIPFGRFAIILNGYDQPLKFYGREIVRPFSWTSKPPSPGVLDVEPAVTKTGATGDVISYRSCTIRIDKDSYWGLGTTTDGDINTYSWKISWISDTGSESPLSDSTTITWTLDNGMAGSVEYKYAVCLDDLPIGPEGTVARRIYRSKNKKAGIDGANDTVYFVKQIDDNCSTQWIDFIPDNELISPHDPLTAATTIQNTFKYGAAWNGCVWLAGGSTTPTKIIFSKQQLPEEFPINNFFEVGVRQGGAISALVPFYNSLLVFREKAIDIITAHQITGGDTVYQISTVDPNIGTTATNTIQLVPELGIVFLSKDGIYSLTGGIFGGSQMKVTKISQFIEKDIRRISLGALPRATAVYSSREKEYWVHFPADGATENNRGLVLSIRSFEWSQRPISGITHLAANQNGWIIFGTNLDPTISSANQEGIPGVGLQVWSSYPAFGKGYKYSAITGKWTASDRSRDSSIYESVWEDFGDASIKKTISFVEIECISQGNNAVTLSYATDWAESFTATTGINPQQVEYLDTSLVQPVYGTSSNDVVATWDETNWSNGRIIKMRFDVNTSAVSFFKFKLATSNLFHLINYKIGFIHVNQKTINYKG